MAPNDLLRVQREEEEKSSLEPKTDEEAEAKQQLLSQSTGVSVISNHRLPPKDDGGDEYGYGIGGWKPGFLQCLSNRKAFLVIFCLTCVLQGTFHTYFVAVITTLEKLFNIPSQTIGTLMMASEIGQVSSALLLPYYAGSGHRPRWMGVGSALFSLATLLCASPHLLISTPNTLLAYDNNNNNNHIEHNFNDTLMINSSMSSSSSQFCSFGNNFTCSENRIEEMLDNQQSVDKSKYLLFAIIFTSLLTIGFGQTAIFTLGIPYLDDNVANRDSPLYFSITIGVRILGPVMGFILGSLCTRLYINPGSPPSDYGPTDPRWLGAWWLGMLIISFLLFLTSILMFAFPIRLKPQQQQLENKENNLQIATITSAATNTTNTTNSHAAPPLKTLRNFPAALKRLLSNRILLLRTFSSVFHLLPISGLYTFLPKYLESQFRLAAFQANMVTGIAGILVMGIGIFGSGVFIRRKEPSAKNIALWVALAAFVYSGGMGGLAFIGCDSSKDFVKPNLALGQSFNTPSCLTNECSECSSKLYAPVCGSDDLIYFSACHAGCPPPTLSSNLSQQIYKDCKCVQDFDSVQTATPGLCELTCSSFPYYQTLFMLIVLIHSTSEVGSMLLTLRCVEPRDKAMALGLIQCAIGLFGNVPCPVIYGAVVDSACIIWGDNSQCSNDGDDTKGHCWVYESNTFRIRFHGLTGLLMLVAFIIDMVIYYQARSINFLEEETNGTETNGENGDEETHQMNELNNK